MLLRMYQVFSSLQGHLHFFVHFLFTFMGQFFLGHPKKYASFRTVKMTHAVFDKIKVGDYHMRKTADNTKEEWYNSSGEHYLIKEDRRYMVDRG